MHREWTNWLADRSVDPLVIFNVVFSLKNCATRLYICIGLKYLPDFYCFIDDQINQSSIQWGVKLRTDLLGLKWKVIYKILQINDIVKMGSRNSVCKFLVIAKQCLCMLTHCLECDCKHLAVSFSSPKAVKWINCLN